MKLGEMRRRCGAGIAGGLLAMGLLPPATAVAGEGDPCRYQGKGVAVPQCVTATHSDTLKADQTQDINLHCPAEAPYYWEGWSDTFASRWHVMTENLLVEDRFHAHFKISNTRLGPNPYSVTIGCSPISESGTCQGPGRKVSDPGCPESNRRAVCIPDEGGADCWAEWTEICTGSGEVTTYFCSDAGFLTSCFSCGG